MSGRPTLAHAFEDAGIERDKAEGLATAVLGAIRDNVATKTDLTQAIADLKHELTMRGLAALVSAIGILFAALHLWPPGHG